MQPLSLAVNPEGWRAFVRRREDKAFQPVQERVFRRDTFTCQYCGFQARQFQQVVNLDGNYANNRLGNLITACCFCSQCLFLESIDLEGVGGGQLIYLPEMTQADLNSFCHVLFCALGNGTGYQESAESIYRDMKFRSQPVENRFGAGSSQPAAFGQMVLEYRYSQAGQAADLERVLADFRLLPSHTKFRVQLEAWAADAVEEISAQEQQ